MSTKNTDSLLPLRPFTSAEKGQVLARLRSEKPDLTIRELAQMTGISEGHVSKLLKHQQPTHYRRGVGWVAVGEDQKKLESALAEIRDLFQIPHPIGELHDLWAEAIGKPEAVPAYVKAQIAALRGDKPAQQN